MTTQDEIEGPKTTRMRSQRTHKTLPPTRCVPRATRVSRSGRRTCRMKRTARKLRKFGSGACPNEIEMNTHGLMPATHDRTQ